jgi:hypothetical protein
MREFPPFRLDTVNECLWRGEGVTEERILLAPKALAVLRYLVEHPGRLVGPCPSHRRRRRLDAEALDVAEHGAADRLTREPAW